MIVEQSKQIIAEVNKAFIGRKDIVEKILMTIYAGGMCCWRTVPVWARPRSPWRFPARWD